MDSVTAIRKNGDVKKKTEGFQWVSRHHGNRLDDIRVTDMSMHGAHVCSTAVSTVQ